MALKLGTFAWICPLFLAGCATVPPPVFVNPWAGVRAPVAASAESIGAHAAGCLVGGIELPESGEGFVRVSPRANRQYGHPFLIGFLTKIGRAVRRAKERPFLVADLGMPRGGPTLTGHASHQNGLDADVWFRREIGAKDPRFFGDEQIALLRRFARADVVERVFVNPRIKKRLCSEHANEAWLRKVRPWYGHDTHFHVRLNCPKDSPRCVSAADPIPPGDGCDATLAWWDTDEARVAGEARAGTPLSLPILPDACATVLGFPEVGLATRP